MNNDEMSLRVLLLDDDEDDYQLTKAMFHDAFDKRVKLDWFQQDHFSTMMICSGLYDIVMVDYRLGLEDGLEIIRKAKAECPNVIVFLFSGWPDPDLEERARQVGANGSINKSEMSISKFKTLFETLMGKK